jgi:hypothetical protein
MVHGFGKLILRLAEPFLCSLPDEMARYCFIMGVGVKKYV